MSQLFNFNSSFGTFTLLLRFSATFFFTLHRHTTSANSKFQSNSIYSDSRQVGPSAGLIVTQVLHICASGWSIQSGSTGMERMDTQVSARSLASSSMSTRPVFIDDSDADMCQAWGGGGAGTSHNSRKIQLQQWRKVLACVLALGIPLLFPSAHMYLFTLLWGHLKIPVDRSKCTCTCWDTIFKGPYELGVAKYKHVYFNSNSNTLKMWILTVIGVLFLYEAFKRFFLILLNKKLRWTMGLLFLCSLYSHYFGWWNHWGFLNDDFYPMWYHQCIFTVTEVISSIIVLRYLDLRQAIEPTSMLVVSSIAIFHAFCGSLDQFVLNVVAGQGQFHQVIRDIPLMLADVLHAAISLYEISSYAQRKGISLKSILTQRTNVLVVSTLLVLMSIFSFIFPSD